MSKHGTVSVSTNAIATVVLTESVITLIYAVAIGLSMAATAVVARGARGVAAATTVLGGATLLKDEKKENTASGSIVKDPVPDETSPIERDSTMTSNTDLRKETSVVSEDEIAALCASISAKNISIKMPKKYKYLTVTPLLVLYTNSLLRKPRLNCIYDRFN